METIYIILLTLIIYSLIATIVITATNENDNLILAFALGITGGIITLVICIIRKTYNYFKYHYNKRSIFEEIDTEQYYKCKIKDANDICWSSEYSLIRRYAPKSRWKDLPDFSKEFIEKSRRNCDHCRYDKECLCDFPYDKIKCKHNEFGRVIEFDKFEKGRN